MMPYIAEAAKTLRLQHGITLAEVAVARKCREITVTRFETGRMRAFDVDAMIAAYAAMSELPEVDFWQRALQLWEASLNGRSRRKRAAR